MKTSQEHDPRHPGRRLRLPHERDESPDSQSSGQRSRIRQAAHDVEAGRGDTDARASPGIECVETPRQARQARPHLHEADPAEQVGLEATQPARKN